MEMILIVLLTICVFVGVYANSRGRSGFGWFLLAVVTSPLIAWLILIMLPRKNRVVFISDDGAVVLSDGKVMTMTHQGGAMLSANSANSDITTQFHDPRVWYVIIAVLFVVAALIVINGLYY